MIQLLPAFLIILNFLALHTHSQSAPDTLFRSGSFTNSQIYPPEGVYASFSSFKNGKPEIVKTQFVKSATADAYTIRQWVNSEKLYYLDSANMQQSFDPMTFWGFVEKETLFLFLGNKFHKVNVLGKISYFLESYPIIKGNMAPVVTDARSTSAYMLMDMETGDIIDYTVENLMDLLEKDEEIFTEYKSIVSQKEKKKKMFIFMERYNAKHPLQPVKAQGMF